MNDGIAPEILKQLNFNKMLLAFSNNMLINIPMAKL